MLLTIPQGQQRANRAIKMWSVSSGKNMFDNTVPVATNAQCVSWHMFEPNPNVLVIMFAGLHRGDGEVTCQE